MLAMDTHDNDIVAESNQPQVEITDEQTNVDNIQTLKAALAATTASSAAAVETSARAMKLQESEELVVATNGHESNGISSKHHSEDVLLTEPVVEITEQTMAPTDSTTATQTIANGVIKTMTPLLKEQFRHCLNIMKGLKRHSQGGPFLLPVDPVALGIPDYLSVITRPMDLSTVQKKLDSSSYETVEQFRDDVKLMFSNCYTYNKPETQVYAMAKNLERYFDSQWAKLPTELTQAQDDFGGKRKRSDASPTLSRPRRESSTPHRTGSTSSTIIPAAPASRAKRTSAEMTYCMTLWKELTKKSNYHIAWPFLEPVDPIKLGIPDYPSIVTKPMDLTTVKKKLETGLYDSADQFREDVKLIFQNCYLYNGVESEVARLGKELDSIFDQKWAVRPTPVPAGSFGDYDPDAEKILTLNKQIQALQKELDELLIKRQGRSSSVAPKTAPKKSRPLSSNMPDTMTFEEKRQLSVDVNNLSPEKLGRVVEIIHNSMPNLQQNSDSDVIELDIESLDISTLRQLQKYVNECKGIVPKKRKPSGISRPKKAAAVSGQAGGDHPSLPAPALEETLSSDDSSSSDDDMA